MRSDSQGKWFANGGVFTPPDGYLGEAEPEFVVPVEFAGKMPVENAKCPQSVLDRLHPVKHPNFIS